MCRHNSPKDHDLNYNPTEDCNDQLLTNKIQYYKNEYIRNPLSFLPYPSHQLAFPLQGRPICHSLLCAGCWVSGERQIQFGDGWMAVKLHLLLCHCVCVVPLSSLQIILAELLAWLHITKLKSCFIWDRMRYIQTAKWLQTQPRPWITNGHRREEAQRGGAVQCVCHLENFLDVTEHEHHHQVLVVLWKSRAVEDCLGERFLHDQSVL